MTFDVSLNSDTPIPYASYTLPLSLSSLSQKIPLANETRKPHEHPRFQALTAPRPGIVIIIKSPKENQNLPPNKKLIREEKARGRDSRVGGNREQVEKQKQQEITKAAMRQSLCKLQPIPGAVSPPHPLPPRPPSAEATARLFSARGWPSRPSRRMGTGWSTSPL